MKRSFVCRVESIRGLHALVTMHNRKSTERLEATFRAPTLAQIGIHLGDEFLCVLRDNQKLLMRKLRPKAISKDRLNEIRKQFEGRWSF